MGLNITVASKFNPFTYDDYIKPYKENIDTYFKNYRDTENKLSDLDTQLEALDYIIESEPEDSPLKSTYGNYKKELEKAAEALSAGWSQADVQNYNKLKQRFAKDISPIATQYARRQKLEDEQRKEKVSKPSIYFSKRAAETSLAEMIDNPNWSYTSFVGDDITKAVQSMVSPVATILDNIWKEGQVGDYDKILSKYGISPEDVSAYFNGNLTGGLAKFFDDARNTAIKSYGVDTWNDQEALNTAYQYANIGIPKAIGKLTSQLVSPKKPTGGGAGDPANPVYPGSALNFDVSTKYTPDAEKAKIAENNYTYNQGISDNDYRHSDVALMEADFKKKGLDVKDLDEYETYLTDLAKAKQKDATTNRRSSSIYFDTGTFGVSNVETVRKQYDNKYRKIESQINQKDIDLYKEALSKQQDFVKRYSIEDDSNVDNRTGLYTNDIKSSMDIGTRLEKTQSQEEMFIGTHKWDDDTKKAIVGQLKSQYETLVSTGNVEEKGNGLYQMSFENGKLSTDWVKPKKLPTKFWDNVDIVFTAQEGMLLRYTDPISSKPTLYKLKGSDFTGDSQEVIDMYKESKDFSPDSIKKYITKQNEYHGTKGNSLGVYDLYSLLDKNQNSQLVQTLIENKSIIRSTNNKNYGIAYVHALYPTADKDGNPQYTVAKIVIDLRTGEKVSVTTVDNELGDDGLGYSLSTRYAQDKLQGIAYTKSNDALNLNTKAAQRTKGSNPIRDEYILE